MHKEKHSKFINMPLSDSMHAACMYIMLAQNFKGIPTCTRSPETACDLLL